MQHPDEQFLKLFTEGRLTERQEDAMERHLAVCELCRTRLDALERQKTRLTPFLHDLRMAGCDNLTEEFTSGILLNNQFRLERKIGSGGMGVAWKAVDETANRSVVLKFVSQSVLHLSEALTHVRESFQKVHALQHSHICPLYGLFDDPSYGLYLAMKFIDGVSLDENRRGRGILTSAQTVNLLLPVASGLDYAHAQKVIHRDIKPQNIMVSRSDGVQIIDFGLAAEIRNTLSQKSVVPDAKITGTRSYMAPEQWEGRFDVQTDQYALAVTAYELLSGRVPFAGRDVEILRRAVLESAPPPLPDQPDYVNTALLRALAKNPKDRFASCRAFVEALVGSPADFPADSLTGKARSDRQVATRPKWIVPTALAGMFFFVLLFWTFRIFVPFSNDKREWKRHENGPSPVEKAQKALPPAPSKTSSVASGATSLPVPAELPLTLPTATGYDPLLPEGENASSTPTEAKAIKDSVAQAQSKKRRFNIPRRNELFQVVRVMASVDENGVGRLMFKRGVSAEPYPTFRGTQFNFALFEGAYAFRGDDPGLGRVMFPFGNVTLPSENMPMNYYSTEKRTFCGWECRLSGGKYDSMKKTMKFSSAANAPEPGFSIAKPQRLPSVIYYEVIDDTFYHPPNLKIEYFVHRPNTTQGGGLGGGSLFDYATTYSELAATVHCTEKRDSGGQIRISALVIFSSGPNRHVSVAENLSLDKNTTLVKTFVFPSEMAKRVNKINYTLTVASGSAAMRSGFDLTFLDVVGKFTPNVGFIVKDDGLGRGTFTVERLANGPLSELGPEGNIIGVNGTFLNRSNGVDQSESVARIFESLSFGDEVTVNAKSPSFGQQTRRDISVFAQ